MFLVSPLVTIHLKDKKADINARCYIIMCFFFLEATNSPECHSTLNILKIALDVTFY